MDWTLVVIIVAGGVVIILIALAMLNRAWGDFPGKTSGLPPMMPPMMPPSPPPSPGPASFSPPSELPAMELPAGAMSGTLVPVMHPMVRRAVLAAMERGGTPASIYFIRDGETLYLVPSRIADPQQRQVMIRMFTSLNNDTDGNLSLGDVVRVLQEMTRK